MGMLSPGPVVITATFVGYLVAGFWGAVVSTIGIFLPSFLLVLIVAPILVRHRANPNVQGFVKGAYAAAIGDRKSTRLNSSHGYISYAVFCLKKKKRPTKKDLMTSQTNT